MDSIKGCAFLAMAFAARADQRELYGITRRTWQRWITGKSTPHPAAQALVSLAADGRILDPDHWQGFRVDGNTLTTPEGLRLTAGDLQACFFWKQSHEELQRISRTCTLQRKFDFD